MTRTHLRFAGVYAVLIGVLFYSEPTARADEPPLGPAPASGQWNPWFPIHAEQRFQPGAKVSAVWANTDHLDLFAVDDTGTVRSTWWQADAGWQAWFPIGENVRFDPHTSVTALWANPAHLDLFALDANGVVQSTWWEPDAGWQAWFPIHSEAHFAAGASVTVVWANAGHLDLFVSGLDGSVWSTWWEAGADYQPWFGIHVESQFALGAQVSALWANSSHLDLFITGSDGAVWSTWWDADAGWQAWFPIEPEVLFQPGARVSASWANEDHLDLFVTGSDGAVWSSWWDADSGWQAWFTIDTNTKARPGASVSPVWANEDHLDLFMTDAQGVVHSEWWHQGVGYAQWFAIHPETTFAPGAPVSAVWANEEHLDLFVTGADGVIWSSFYADTESPEWALLANDGVAGQPLKSTYFFAGNWRCCRGWDNWWPVGRTGMFDALTTPTALYANERHLDVFATDHDGVVWSNNMEVGETGWQGWFEIHPETKFAAGAPVSAVWANDEHLDLFVTDGNGSVWTSWWEASAAWQAWFRIDSGGAFFPGGAVTALWANDSHLDLFVSDVHGVIWSTWWEAHAGWQPWFALPMNPGVLFAPGAKVSAVWANADHLDLFMTDQTGVVRSTWWEARAGWQAWFAVHPEQRVRAHAPITARWANDTHLDLFVSGDEGAVWSTWWQADSDWQRWFPIHGEMQFAPRAAVSAQWTTSDHLDLYVTGKDGAVWSSWWEADPGWANWFEIHPEVKLRPGSAIAVTFSGDRTDLFGAGDNTVWSSHYPGYPLSKFYEYPMSSNEHTYTRHPSDTRDLGWSEDPANQSFAVDKMIEGGVNVITMSYWGEPGTDRWAFWAPMHTSTAAHDELFRASVGKNILIMPAIESGDATFACGGHSPAYHFASDFPGAADNPAPQLVAQLEDLIGRYLIAPSDPAWASKWAQMYDRQGEKRYAVNILHVASNQIGADEHARFAAGFDRVAARVYANTGVKIGFTLDLLWKPGDVNNGGCGKDELVEHTFVANAEDTGPWLRQQASFLAVQAFVPEVYVGSSNDAALLAFKGDYLQRWINARVPVMLDADPGYDAHVVFTRSEHWGNDDFWRAEISLLQELDVRGIVFNTWNGYTEGFAAVPTLENGDADFRWMQSLFAQ